jgi:hypothetical protein
MAAGAPVFILAHPRSGASLLRHILEAHPSVSRTRRRCDSAASNLGEIDRLRAAAPDARFVALHRHGLDVAHSHLEAGGDSGTAFDVVTRVVGSWCDYGEQLVRLEAALGSSIFRIRYEDVAGDESDARVRELCGFLDLEPVSGLTERLFANTGRFRLAWLLSLVGPRWMRNLADDGMRVRRGARAPEAPYSIAILTGRAGRGRELDVSALPDALISRMNHLLATIGYDLQERTHVEKHRERTAAVL